MQRSAFLTGAIAAAVVLIPGLALAQQNKVLNVYNWTDYIAPNTVADFSKATGIKVNYDTYDSLETLEGKLLAGNSGYDIIVPTAEPTLDKLIKAKAVLKLDKSKIPNLKNLDPGLMKRLAEHTDPGNQHAVIYAWGTIGLGINPDKIKAVAPDAPLDSFALLFDPKWAAKVASCGITILDSSTDTLPTALNYLHLNPNSEKPADLKKVEAMLKKVRPYVRNFTSTVINDLAGGDTCVALAYSGDVIQAQAKAKDAGNKVNVQYVTPKEGVQLWFDTMAIPAGAPDVEAAYKFINYILDPKVEADFTNAVNYGNAVPASMAGVNADIRNNPAVFPPDALRKNMFTAQSTSPKAERERTRAWTLIKTGK